MRCKSYLALFICLLTLSCDDAIDPDTSGRFMKFYGGAQNEIAYAVEELPNGGFIIVGTTESFTAGGKDVFLIRTDANGNRKWQNSYGGPGDDAGKAIQVSPDGHYFILGYTTAENFKDFYLLKINQEGDTVFTRNFGLPSRHEEGTHLQPTLDGGFALIGNASAISVSSNKDVYLVKTNQAGDTPVYERLYGLPGRIDTVGTILEADNGDLVWCGTFVRETTSSMRIVKSDAFGNLKWDFPFNNSAGDKNASGMNIQKTADGYIAVGTIETGESTDIFLVRISENGKETWSTTLHDPANPNANESGAYVYPTSDGGFIVTGTITKPDTGSDIFLIKTDSEGNPQWTQPKIFGGTGNDSGSFVKQTADGGYVILGTVNIVNNTVISLIKTDENGNIPGQ